MSATFVAEGAGIVLSVVTPPCSLAGGLEGESCKFKEAPFGFSWRSHRGGLKLINSAKNISLRTEGARGPVMRS